MYVFQAFPKWKYHESGESLIVDNEDAEAALGEGWHDLPQPPKEIDARQEMIAVADAKGIKIDKRWSDERIKAALDAVPETPVEGA